MAKLAKNLDCTPISLGSSVSRAVACPNHPPIGLVGKGRPELPSKPKLREAWFSMYRDWKPKNMAGKRLQNSAKVVEELATKLDGRMASAAIRHPFAGDEFGQRFELAFRLIASGFPSKLIHLSAGKFDTHSAQASSHPEQLAQLDRASHAFLENMKALERPVTMMVYSEFGRRVQENFSGGTDHGAGGLAWIVGDGVKGGLVGDYQLHNLRDGDLATSLDFRKLYSEAVTSSFGRSYSRELFGDLKLRA